MITIEHIDTVNRTPAASLINQGWTDLVVNGWCDDDMQSGWIDLAVLAIVDGDSSNRPTCMRSSLYLMTGCSLNPTSGPNTVSRVTVSNNSAPTMPKIARIRGVSRQTAETPRWSVGR